MNALPEIYCPLRDHALQHGDAIAISSAKREITYARLDTYVDTIAEHLRARGVSEGAVVGLAIEPSVESVAYVFALIRIKAVAVGLNTRNPIAAQGNQLQAVRGGMLIVRDSAPYEDLVGVTPQRALRFDETCPGDIACAAHKPCALRFHQPATMVFTSGSSGTPRAALHSLGSHLMAAQASNLHNGLGAGDAWLLSLPVYHVAGLGIIFRCIVAGATIVISEGRPELSVVLAAQCVSHLSVVPTQLERLLEAPTGHATRVPLKSILVGGAACDERLVARAHGAGLPVFRTYGMTEMCSQIATVAPGRGAASPSAATGSALPGVDLRISATGEIEVRGAALFLGYVDGDCLERPLTEDGWFRTGDLGTLSRTGELWVTGRIDNMFISGGENIQPEEIEQALCALPGVLQALVVPVEDKTFGQRPVAFVRTESGLLKDAEWSVALDALLPRYKQPTRFLAWPALRSGAEMKLDRRAFRALASDAPAF
ncbi:MAG: o-succinylbenzoate--CoA ligase [Verrucomicrobia bacterium]|nr:o-succinylbenzoate--CoA ligase [Verrucomicrobiota bacterium]